MTTAEKRSIFLKNRKYSKEIEDLILNKQWRELDEVMQSCPNKEIVQYVLTLLCDELVALEDENQDDFVENMGEDR